MCAARLFHRIEGNEGIVSTQPGTLTQPWPAPVAHVWTDSALAWESLDSDRLLCSANPERLDGLFLAWEGREGLH